MTPLYEDEGRVIATHSMIKTFRRCPKQAEYKYVRRLKPKVLGRPLRAGTWFHKLLEAKTTEGDWRPQHELLTKQFSELFDEEKDEIGDLPTDMARLMRSYEWHYASDEWIIHETELVLETTFPDGTVYRGKIDNLIENQFGLWIVDHKTSSKGPPDHGYRIIDAQSALYIWAAIRCGIPVQGHIWNYVKSVPPTRPQLILSGKRVSRWEKCATDYPTAARFFKQHEDLDLNPYKLKLRRLKNLRYQPGEPQLSPFFRRTILEKNDEMLRQVAREGYHTAKLMNEYPWDRPDFVERVPSRSCQYDCSYAGLCGAELFTGGTPVDLMRRYEIGDPMDYYQDDRQEKEQDA